MRMLDEIEVGRWRPAQPHGFADGLSGRDQ
jgi:hypothetical protein